MQGSPGPVSRPRFEHAAKALDHYYEVYAFLVDAAQQHHVGILFNDIRERKKSEAALRQSEATLGAAFTSIPEGIGVIDLSGEIVIANEKYRRFLPEGKIPSRDIAHIARWRAWDQEGRLLGPQDFPGARALRGESVIPGQEMLYTDDDGKEI